MFMVRSGGHDAGPPVSRDRAFLNAICDEVRLTKEGDLDCLICQTQCVKRGASPIEEPPHCASVSWLPLAQAHRNGEMC